LMIYNGFARLRVCVHFVARKCNQIKMRARSVINAIILWWHVAVTGTLFDILGVNARNVSTVYLRGGAYANVHANATAAGRRRLSALTDPKTGQAVRTVGQIIPVEKCPVGYYRPTGASVTTAPRQDGCAACPRGKFGQALSGTPCVDCPLGTYGDEVGLTKVTQCQLCPQGRYALVSGLTTRQCSGKCSPGKYSDKRGSTTAQNCLVCPTTSQDWQCRAKVEPRSAKNGPVVLTKVK